MLTRILLSWIKTREHVEWSSLNTEIVKAANWKQKFEQHWDLPKSICWQSLWLLCEANGIKRVTDFLFLSLCFSFKCRQMYHAPTDCATIRKWLTKCADDSETANYISAHTKDVRETRAIYYLMAVFPLLFLSRAVCGCGVKARIQNCIHPYNRILLKLSLDWSIHLCRGRCVVSFLSQAKTSLQICDGCAGI